MTLEIAVQHGCAVDLHPPPGCGVTFELRLPMGETRSPLALADVMSDVMSEALWRSTTDVGGVVLGEGMESIAVVAVTATARDDIPQGFFDVDTNVDMTVDMTVDMNNDLGIDADNDLGIDADINLGIDADINLGIDADNDLEVDVMLVKWAAERWTAEHGEYDKAQEFLDALLEARAIKSSAEAREQQCLAMLEAIALESADGAIPANAAISISKTREIAWRSMAAEIAVATRQADRTVQSMMSQATALVHDLPAVLDALGCGRISFGHARVILEHAVGVEDDALKEYQQITLDRAETTTPGKLAVTARIAADRLRAETFEERHERARDARRVSIRDLDNGMSELLHLLPTPFAAAIFDRLTRQAKAVAATGDPRTRDQLRSDLATDLLLTGEPDCGENAPHTAAAGIHAEVSIVIPALTLLGEGDEPARLAGRGPIDLDTACQLAGMAPELVRVLTHPVTGMVITADTYRPTASLRRYLTARDRHCQFPTCNRDARWCDLDHTFAWEGGGKSTPDNLAHLCRGHHTIKHHGGWKVRQTTPGVLEWTSPLGKVVTDTAPPGPRFVPRLASGFAGESHPPF